MIKPSVPKGTRDFGPDVVRRRNFILNTIRNVFEKYGFQPLETPAIEKLSTLTGKYGEEGDKLMFRILNNGDIFSEASGAKDSKTLAARISNKALRYDLTIPFARYVVMHRNEIVFPFRRYQIQPVWRADRPQKGRYREFFQCDADIVGSDSLINEQELLAVYDTVFHQLHIEVSLHVNNRKLLAGLAEVIGKADRLTDITIAIDKLDKVGLEGVKRELGQRNLSDIDIAVIEKYLNISGNNSEKLQRLQELLESSEMAQKGIAELKTVLQENLYSFHSDLILNPTLARGLNYYTGTILEVKAPKSVKMGSVGGGGRYDDLTGLFGLPDVSGVGISFGVDRIYDVLEQLNLFPEIIAQSTKVLFLQMEPEALPLTFRLMKKLRDEDLPSEIYPDAVKFDKQLKYANKRKIPYVVIIGENELRSDSVSVKDMLSGRQEQIPGDRLLEYLMDRTRS